MLKSINTNKKVSAYLCYTVFFIIMVLILSLPFVRLGKSLVMAKDGLYQHYNAFVYLGTYIRSIVRNLISTHKLVIPMWEFGIGYGADSITTLSYYVVGDPLTLLSAVTPVRYADVMYSLLILVRFYLAGAAFCMYSEKMKCDRFASVCAGLGYVFCGMALHAAVMHPYFANPMIYLPLLLIGVEKIFRKEKPLLFVFMVFVSCISNYYFFYQLVLIVALYVVIRCLTMYKEKEKFKYLLVFCVRFAGLGLIGVAMAAVIFLPSIMAFVSNSRINSGYQYSLLYPGRYYRALAGAYIANMDPGEQTYIGITPILLLGMCGLYIKRKEHEWLRWLLGIMTFFLMVPLFGRVFNGFGYVCNRWSYAYVFFIAYAFASMLPQIAVFQRKEKFLLGISVLIYTIICVAFYESRREAVFLSMAVLWISLFLVLNIREIGIRLRSFAGRYKELIIRCMIAAAAMLGIWSNGYYLYGDTGAWYASRAHDMGKCYQDIAEITSLTEDLTSTDDSFYRLDIHEGNFRDGGNAEGRNALISNHQSTTSMYWSVLSPGVVSYVTENSAYGGVNFEYRNLQSRSLLLPFASAKYYVHAGDGEFESYADVPYGYEYHGKKVGVKGNLFSVYRSELALPLGYTYDAYLTASEYNAMSVEERQQAMLYGVVLDDSVCKEMELEQASPQFTQQSVKYVMESDDNIEINGRQIVVKKADAGITFRFESQADRELYLKIDSLNFEGKKPSELMTKEEWDDCSKWEKENIRIAERSWDDTAYRTWIIADCGGRSTGLEYFNVYDHVYDGREEYLFNLGYSREKRNTATLSFSEPGVYSYDEITVIEQPLDVLDDQIELLKRDILEETEITDNRIRGVITVDQTKALCLSVPYSEGWRAYVDGQETEVLQSNVMYMGVLIPKGTHNIELRYETPYLKMGILISAVGFCLFLALGVYVRKNGKI